MPWCGLVKNCRSHAPQHFALRPLCAISFGRILVRGRARPLLACCGATEHPWDRYNVPRDWFPRSLRCLIIGENPGYPATARSLTPSEYFYTDPPRDNVVVREALLHGLHREGLIPEARLKGFRDAGFLFDHAIRCLLPKEVVKRERQAAMRYASHRVEHPDHLRALAQARVVWVMGHLASNAVANIADDFPKERRLISKPPWPGELAPRSRFFLSEYFARWNEKKAPAICEAFSRFARGRGVFDDSA